MVSKLLQGHCHQRDDIKFQLGFCVSSGHSQNLKKYIQISFPLKSSNIGCNFEKYPIILTILGLLEGQCAQKFRQ